jgi:parallel beta-helix repeat protein
MKSKSIVILLIILLIVNCFIFVEKIEYCKADILPKFYVDDDYDNSTPGWQIDHFNVIQDAIDASSSSDRIVVYAGTYNENLVITHSLDIFGEERNTTFIDGGDTGDVINISSKYVNISHFTIRDSGNNDENASILISFGNAIITDNIITSSKHGISISNCDDNIIYDNIIKINKGNGIQLNNSNSNEITYNKITKNSNGLFLHDSLYNIIKNNKAIKENDINGLFLNETCDYNTISYNNISENDINGLFLNDHCDHNTLSNNDIFSNGDSGIRLENSSTNKINNSVINSNTFYGIMIVGSSNEIINSEINSNGEHGIFLFADDNNVVKQNTIKGNKKDGISLSNSTLDQVYKNEISDNSRYGIKLDFFTLQNLIYNNYLHDNSDNAIDKSINNNNWYTTKTNATNIVGGPFIYGNYWDDFDEISEGALDSNSNGIADSPFTIYAGNKDNGPLLDVTPPTIGTPKVSPSYQTVGEYTYISITILDNTEIKEAYLNYIDPYGELNNISITNNSIGNTYYCNKQFSPVGSYSFYIEAKDPRNWVVSTNESFYINKGTPPTIDDNSPSTGSPSKPFTFKATVTDNEESTSGLTVKLQWTHKDSGGNVTLDKIYQNYFETTITLDRSTEDLVYVFYATDKWGNSVTTTQKSVKITDIEPPEIIIKKYGASTDNMPNKFTFNAKISDNLEVHETIIEYWYGSNDHVTVNMDDKGNNIYEKNIQLSESTSRVYCIIYATDTMGNQNDTKNPFAVPGGPYSGVVAMEYDFLGEDSFDLDGEIAEYLWDFGDGTTASAKNPSHVYSSSGKYKVKLTVTDNDGNTGSETTTAVVDESTVVKTNIATMDKIEKYFDIELTELFFGYDTDGDLDVDKFIDPNSVLKAVQSGGINISGKIYFLLSTDDGIIPEFLWCTSTNEIINVSYSNTPINKNDISVDNDLEIATATITVSKSDWIYIETDDKYPGSTLTIKAGERKISSDMIWRNNDKIFILDDPDTVYTIVFSEIYPDVESPTIFPIDGGLINENQTTITLTYNVPVSVVSATFGTKNVKSKLKKSENIEISYKPPGYLEDGIYDFEITVKALNGDSQETTIATYFYYSYTSPPPIPEKSFIEQNLFFIILGIIGGSGAVLYFLSRYNYITFQSFVYFKNRKIIPFFKPLVFGPLRIDVNDEKVKKAEFYVNGILKDTITEAPYIWNWNETSFLRQKIETKIFDQDGNTSSSGEQTYFVFNSPRLFK